MKKIASYLGDQSPALARRRLIKHAFDSKNKEKTPLNWKSDKKK